MRSDPGKLRNLPHYLKPISLRPSGSGQFGVPKLMQSIPEKNHTRTSNNVTVRNLSAKCLSQIFDQLKGFLKAHYEKACARLSENRQTELQSCDDEEHEAVCGISVVYDHQEVILHKI
jgi:hypothetical protein